MRMEHRGRIFGVKLGADVPALLGYLDNLDEVGGGVDAYTLHASPFVLFLIGIVELIAVAVALADEQTLQQTLPQPLLVMEGSR